MTERRREAVFAFGIALLIALGLLYEAMANPVSIPPERPVAEGLFEERALFCPSIPQGAEGKAEVTIFSSDTEAAVPVGLGGETDVDAEVPEGEVSVIEVEDRVPLNVIGKGAALSAAVSMRAEEPRQGEASTPCARKAAPEWFFPEGSSAFRYDQRILLYNPFPDEAVMQVRFVTPGGERAPAGLANIGVPAGELVQVRLEKAVEIKELLSTVVSSVRGRVVAWRLAFEKLEGRPEGVDLSLGSTTPSPNWFFPVGAVGEGSDERVTVMNPGDREATFSVSFVTAKDVIQPPELVEITVRPNRSRSFLLGEIKTKKGEPPGEGSVIVRSGNGAPIVAEHTVVYESDGLEGTASEMGIPAGAKGWWIGPAVASPTTDRIALMNLGSSDARVTATVLSQGAPLELEPMRVPPGGPFVIDLSDENVEGQSAVLLESDQDVAVERVAQSKAGDIGLIAGVPITPIEP